MALKTELNTPQMERRIRQAFRKSGLAPRTFSTAFEHGQWWIITQEPPDSDHDERTYSVVDEEPGIDGFGFEEV